MPDALLFALKVAGAFVLVALFSYTFGKFAAAGVIRTIRRNGRKRNETHKSNEQTKQ